MHLLRLIVSFITVLAAAHICVLEAYATDKDKRRIGGGLLSTLERRTANKLSDTKSGAKDDILMKIKEKCLHIDCKTQTEESKISRQNVVNMLMRRNVEQYDGNIDIARSDIERQMEALQTAKMTIAKANGLEGVLTPKDDGLWDRDMILATEQSEAITENVGFMASENGEANRADDEGNLHKRKRRNVYHFENFPNYKWELPIPYIIRDQPKVAVFTREERQYIKDAINDIESKTCVRFIESNLSSALTFHTGLSDASLCGRSTFGKRAQINEIFLRKCNKNYTGVVIHNIMHALGFHHTHNRADRDQFIEIKSKNFDPRLTYVKSDENIFTSYGVAYDYHSIMHFGNADLSINDQPALVAKKEPVGYFTSVMGRRTGGLSSRDAEMVQKAYCLPNCRDKHVWCGYRKLKGYCKEENGFFDIMKKECKKSCNFCAGTK